MKKDKDQIYKEFMKNMIKMETAKLSVIVFD